MPDNSTVVTDWATDEADDGLDAAPGLAPIAEAAAMQSSAIATYEAATGEFVVQLDDVSFWSLQSFLGQFNGAANIPTPGAPPPTLTENSAEFITEWWMGNHVTVTANTGPVIEGPLPVVTEANVGDYFALTYYEGGFATIPIAGTINVIPIPEPGTLLLLASGLFGLAAVVYRRRRT